MADRLAFDPADGHDAHDAVGEEDLVGVEEVVDVDRRRVWRGCRWRWRVEDGGAGDAGEDAALRGRACGGDVGSRQVVGVGGVISVPSLTRKTLVMLPDWR